jgi:hypothetical protein
MRAVGCQVQAEDILVQPTQYVSHYVFTHVMEVPRHTISANTPMQNAMASNRHMAASKSQFIQSLRSRLIRLVRKFYPRRFFKRYLV